MMLTAADVQALVDRWADRLQVQVKRVQIRTMRTKWGSISTAGVLTLADDILNLPPDLAEYIVVHELMHLRYPDHRRGWRVSMGMYLPDWVVRDKRLRKIVRDTAVEGKAERTPGRHDHGASTAQ